MDYSLLPQVRPVFDKPPIIEVAATVNFEPIEAKKLALLINKFWDTLGKEQYPFIDFKNDPPEFSGVHFEIEAINHQSQFKYPKYWFESHGKADLIQISNRKVTFNWRKFVESDENKYKSFSHVWSNFIHALTTLERVLSDDRIVPVGLELAYFNMIKFSDFGGKLSRINDLYPALNWLQNTPWLGEPNAFNFTWNIPDEKENRNTTIQSITGVETSTGEPMLRLDIVTKSQLNENTYGVQSEAFEEWFKKSHYLLINTFTSLTSEKLQHEVWKRGKDE